MSPKKFAPLPLAVFVGVVCGQMAMAEEAEKLDEVVVIAKEEQKSTGEIKKTRRAIQDELISDSRDLVRYTTDVGIVDNGRHNKGFAMRGVEGNRVAITIDGVSIPDFEENSLYARYGNFNSSRLAIDPELVESIDLIRGADSFNLGTGALGGGVSYRTLGADSIVREGNNVGVLYKNGYGSKNREWTNTLGLAYRDDRLEAVALYSQRRGSEMKSLGNDTGEAFGSGRGKPDPSNHRNHNYLAKLAYFLAENHKISTAYSGQNGRNLVDEKSYQNLGSLWRIAKDEQIRDTFNLAYEYFPQSGLLGYAKVDYDYQRTIVGAINYKGLRDFQTDAPYLNEILNRKMKTKFNRLSLRLDSTPIEWLGGTHELSFRSSGSHLDFENINHDYLLFDSQVSEKISAIQHPVRTTQFSASLADKIQWNDKWRTVIGGRYDYTKVAPKALNAPCLACFKEVPEAVTFQSLTANLGVDYQFTPEWKASYHLSSGYRTPSASEMFFTYEHPSGNWLANSELKPERSINQSVNLEFNDYRGDFAIHLYQTRYKDFLYEQETVGWKENKNCDFRCSPSQRYFPSYFQQAVNFDRAKIEGVEVRGKVNLGEVWRAIPKGFNAMGALGYSKGKIYDTAQTMLPIQPVKVILGFGYDDPQDRFGLQARWTYLGAKKAKDAQILYHYYDTKGETIPFPYLNGSAVLFDTYGFVKPTKNITLRAGVYNLFNRKYQTWDSLRGINQRSTTNSVDREGKGLERFYAPGRNFAASVEINF
ncbi:ligand-gated channel protein [Pasteurellaceae bacterium Macca]|nr:ligand-gated channel protein [Pasteurellaceae bacterium Macca]